ncbi:hypothetical protein JQ609_18305 [Bradyrhizobium sp. AUGA SZCCT0169]|uniref:hypothetical protein n=1 Tax=Bradyrhizobium sp. AUGA SZCCT0169 TaxID=2807663 RepID=UPI001BAD9784|nr:hypothetical protein [Bradyrhizobium sp. AUGA SZCCT0169]MBR1248874.1 hypothetical protein [Bradyrhizobium sp. AUGA SZCCT0169]
MAPNNSLPRGVARPTSTEYFAYHDTAVALIPSLTEESANVIALQRNHGDRCWVVRFNAYPSFSIRHSQLLSATSFRNVAAHQLSHRRCRLEYYLHDLLALPEEGWDVIVERLITHLPGVGGGE